MSTEELTKMLQDMVPQGHLDFARKLLTDHGVPAADEGEDNSLQAARLDRGHRDAAGRDRAARTRR